MTSIRPLQWTLKHDGEACWSQKCPPIFSDVTGVRRLYECVGTRFLIKFLNQLDAEYPFVDNVKPFSRFIRIFGVSSFTPGYGPLKATVMMWALLQYLAQTVTHQPSDLLGLDSTRRGTRESPRIHYPRHVWWCGKIALHRAAHRARFLIDRPIGMLIANRLQAEQLMKFLWIILSWSKSSKKRPITTQSLWKFWDLNTCEGLLCGWDQRAQTSSSQDLYCRDRTGSNHGPHSWDSGSAWMPSIHQCRKLDALLPIRSPRHTSFMGHPSFQLISTLPHTSWNMQKSQLVSHRQPDCAHIKKELPERDHGIGCTWR